MDEELEAGEPQADEPAGPPAEIGREDLMMLLQSVPERVADLVAGLDASRLRYRHGPAFPTAGEVAAHLVAAGLQLDHFITAVSLETGPPPELATMLEAPTTEGAGHPADALPDWQRVRRRGVDLLRGLDSPRWEAAVEDPWRGAMSVEEALRMILRHELGHLAQLRNLTALVPEALPVTPSVGGTGRG